VNAHALESQHHQLTTLHKYATEADAEAPKTGMDIDPENEGTNAKASNEEREGGFRSGIGTDGNNGNERISSRDVEDNSNKQEGGENGNDEGDQDGADDAGHEDDDATGNAWVDANTKGLLNRGSTKTVAGGESKDPSCNNDNDGGGDDYDMDVDPTGVVPPEQHQKRKTPPEAVPDSDLEPQKRPRPPSTEPPKVSPTASKSKSKRKRGTRATRNPRASTAAIAEPHNMSRTMFWIPVDHHPFVSIP